jgi:choline dehydrogenase-like flavoprotein
VCRLRYFGGSTNEWGGWCRPLKPIDFEEQPWVPYSGWPFSFGDLEPYYRRAQAICQLGPYGYDISYLKTQIGSELLPLDQGRLVTDVIQFSPPTRFGEVYRPEIKSAANVRTYLSANVTNIETGEPPNAITRLRAETLSGRKFWITAKCYILAAGGLESARLLLISNAAEKTGLGNRYDLVGRFFMDHPEPEVGLLLPVDLDDRRWLAYCVDYYGRDPLLPLGVLSPRRSILEEEQILHCSVGLKFQNRSRQELGGNANRIGSLARSI